MIRLADPFFNWLAPKLPMKWRTAINQYSTGAQTIQAESDWKIVLRSYLLVMAINSVVVIALILLSSTYLLPVLKANIAG
jgi:CPA2 family monovalent cation:H+ antiporter-2